MNKDNGFRSAGQGPPVFPLIRLIPNGPLSRITDPVALTGKSYLSGQTHLDCMDYRTPFVVASEYQP
ncbi:MAG TPA: hypothetical protein P5563_09500, partial [Saprospiraceae bacterium]|nr:hypothetical protein [Saprospiraceae bacterium]